MNCAAAAGRCPCCDRIRGSTKSASRALLKRLWERAHSAARTASRHRAVTGPCCVAKASERRDRSLHPTGLHALQVPGLNATANNWSNPDLFGPKLACAGAAPRSAQAAALRSQLQSIGPVDTPSESTLMVGKRISESAATAPGRAPDRVQGRPLGRLQASPKVNLPARKK